MSGAGYVQRGILAALTRLPYMSTIELANAVYRGNDLAKEPVTASQLQCVQRAVARLAKEKHIVPASIHTITGHKTWKRP